MPSIEQIRAARALLDWSQSDLAEKSGLSQTGIARLENGTHSPGSATLEKIEAAFDKADIEFLDISGVRKRSGQIKIYRGKDDFRRFMDDVYITARDIGGDICLFNARPQNWLTLLGKQWCVMHANRMAKIKENYNFRTIARYKDQHLIGQAFMEYRWIPENMFNERAFYCYGDKLAFLDFKNDNIDIWVLKHKEFAEGFRTLFQISWDNVASEATISPDSDIRRFS